MNHQQPILNSDALEYFNSRCNLSSDIDPAVVIEWDMTALTAIVEGFNKHERDADLPAVPGFIHVTTQGKISEESLKNDIMTVLSAFSGGRYSNFMLGPNDIVQVGQIRDALLYLQFNQFMQAIGAFFLPENHCLARIWYVTDRDCNPACINPPPAGIVRLFQ